MGFEAPNDTAYSRWNCHSGIANQCANCVDKLCKKQISINSNRIDRWVNLRCAGTHLAQYTDTWTCHLHKECRLTTHIYITPPHPPRPLTKTTPPLPNNSAATQTHVTHSPLFYRIGKAQSTHLPPHPEPNTYTFHTLHQTLSSHTHHSSLARLRQCLVLCGLSC